jgi:hypothetical protein
MNNDLVKKLTGKNPTDFEFAAAHIINNRDINAFSALVEQSDFLFDFIKKNVCQRLSNAVNKSNYKNLIPFLTIYSHDYEDVIVSSLAKFANEDLTDEMLDLLENGTDEQKAYCAKYFSHIHDTLALDSLKKYAFLEVDALAMNSAEALSAMQDKDSYNLALEKLKSEDEFEQISAVRFLSAYKDEQALGALFEALKKSSMPENIASEIPYIKSFVELLDTEFKNDAINAINHIINGIGEIILLGQLFDFQLFDVLQKLINMPSDSKIVTVLLSAKLKFEQLTENEEYIFDEDKDTKQEVYEIKNLLNHEPAAFWEAQEKLFTTELNEQSDFVFSALELVQELNLTEAFDKLKELLNSNNQTIILKTVEVIKHLGKLNEINKDEVLTKISDENIKAIIESLFN